MSARIKIAAAAQQRGWTVADNGRFMSIHKKDEGRYISVTLSTRGAVTTASIVRPDKPGFSLKGEGKAERVIAELMRDAR